MLILGVHSHFLVFLKKFCERNTYISTGIIELSNTINLRWVKMNINDYAWIAHERRLKKGDNIKIPTPYKISIKDNLDKRVELEQIFELLPQAELARWAIENAERFIKYIDIDNEDFKYSIIQSSREILFRRINNEVNTYNLRQAGFLANTLAKKSVSEMSKLSSRVFAQAIFTGHMRSHAIVSSDYAVKVQNLISDADVSTTERNEQIKIARKYLKK